jgi:hypothetical protein
MTQVYLCALLLATPIAAVVSLAVLAGFSAADVDVTTANVNRIASDFLTLAPHNISESDVLFMSHTLARRGALRCIPYDQLSEIESRDVAALLQLALYEQLEAIYVSPDSSGCHWPTASTGGALREREPKGHGRFVRRSALVSALRIAKITPTDDDDSPLAAWCTLVALLVAWVALVSSAACIVSALLCCPVRLAASRLERQLSEQFAHDELEERFYTELLHVTNQVARVVRSLGQECATCILRWNCDVFCELAAAIRKHVEDHPWTKGPREYVIMMSFAGDQREYVVDVASFLEDTRVFYDREDLRIDESCNHGIARGLLQSQCAVAFVSRATFERMHPLAEMIVLLARVASKSNAGNVSLLLVPSSTIERTAMVNFLRIFAESGSLPIIRQDLPTNSSHLARRIRDESSPFLKL